MRRSPTTDPAEPAVQLALALLCFVALLFVFGVARLACGGAIAGWLLAPAFACATAVAVWAARPPGARQALATGARVAAALGLLAAAALGFGALCYDVSWDGQVYHQEGVLALAEGWNPLWQPPLSVQLRPDNIWVNNYPKAAWIAQAILYRATGSLEATKGLQLLPLAAAAVLVFAALRARGVGPRLAAFGAALLAANPVALSQSFSFYCDGFGGSLITALIALYWHWRQRPQPALLAGAAAALLVLENLKFTGPVYAAPLIAAFLVDARVRAETRDHARVLALVLCGSAAAGVLVLGFDPYVTNLLRHGHPFYPLMGRGAVDFIGIQLAPEFHALSRPTRLLVSLFARADEHNVAPAIAWLPALGRDQLRALGYPDLRIGGFGPFFGLSILCGAGLALGGRRLGVAVPARAWALAAVLVATALCNPALWWARYVPQLWLLPAGLFVLAAASPAAGRIGRGATVVLGALLVADLALVGGVAAHVAARATLDVHDQMARLRTVPGPVRVRWEGFDADRERLRAGAVAFREVDVLPCRAPERLLASLARICPPPAPGGGR